MKLFVVACSDTRLYPHFLKHYKNLGVSEFFIATHQRLIPGLEIHSAEFNVNFFSDLDADDSLSGGNAAITAMRKMSQGVDEWSTIVDLDEFLETHAPLEEHAKRADLDRCNVVRGVMIDRFSLTGNESEVSLSSDLQRLMPIKSRFLRNVMGSCDQKGVLVKGRDLAPEANAGHHRFIGERVFSSALEISHFKWISGSVDRLRSYQIMVEKKGIRWSSEMKKAIDHYETNSSFNWRNFGGVLSEDFSLEPLDRCSVCHGIIDHLENSFSIHRYGQSLCRHHQSKTHEKSTPE